LAANVQGKDESVRFAHAAQIKKAGGGMSFVEQTTRWSLGHVGSTRVCALMRMALAVNLWMRFASWLLYFKALPDGRGLLCWAFFISTTFMFFGVKARISTGVAAICVVVSVVYEGYVRGYEPWTHHHVYILAMATVLVALTPCDRSLSFDRWWAMRAARLHGTPIPEERGNLFALRLLATQVAAMYFWTATEKTTLGFLSGDRLEAMLLDLYLWDYPTGAWFHPLMIVVAVSTVLLEYALAFGLFFRKSRRWLLIPGMLLHGLFYVLLPVSTYTLTMWTTYLAFMDPEAIHRFVGQLAMENEQLDLHGEKQRPSDNMV
jgi:hypothetical protein